MERKFISHGSHASNEQRKRKAPSLPKPREHTTRPERATCMGFLLPRVQLKLGLSGRWSGLVGGKERGVLVPPTGLRLAAASTALAGAIGSPDLRLLVYLLGE